LTFRNYEFLVGGGLGSCDYGTEADRRYIYNTYMAANTEYLRSSRQVNILHHFCGLGYSRPNPTMPWKSGETSDSFLEPASEQKFDPYFESYMKNAFAPIGVCIERYDATYSAGSTQAIPVAIYNDTATPWEGEVRLRVVAGGPSITKKDARIIVPDTTAQFTVPPFTKIVQKLQIQVPQVTGDYTLVAEYGAPADRVQSIRDFVVGKKPRWIRDLGPNLALGAPIKVSTQSDNAANDAFKAIDGDWKTNWNLPGETSWIQVDLGAVIPVGSLRLFWAHPEARSVHHHARAYKIAVSADERTWKEVVSITDGDGYHSYHDLGGIPCRFVRLESLKAALPKEGIKLHEFEIYAPEKLKDLFMGINVPGSEVYNWRKARAGLAVGKPAKASSSHPANGSPQAAFDGDDNTRWSSEFSDPQWIAIDLGKEEPVSRVVIKWEAAYAKSYSLETSIDGQQWTQVFKTDVGKGGDEEIKLPTTNARYVRMTGTQRATKYGYSIYEFKIL